MDKKKTLADLYLKDGVDVGELARNLYHYFEEEGQNYPCDIVNFFDKPIKPILSEDEKVILRNIDKNFIVIGRDDRGNLYTNTNAKRTDDIYYEISIFEHLFQFIQPRRRI